MNITQPAWNTPSASENDHPIFPEVHLRDYAHIVLARWPVAVAIWAAILLLALLYTWTRTPRYRASARILVQMNEVNLTDMKGAYDESLSVSGQREFMQTQVQLITSRPVLEATIVTANLLNDPSYRDARDAVAILAKQVAASPVRNTRLIDVAVEREDPQQASRIVNAIVDSFLNENRQRRLGISADGLQDLHRKQEELRTKLDAVTTELQQFMVKNNIVSFEKVQNVVLDTMMAMNRELTGKEPARLALQARVEAAQQALAKGQSIESLPDVIQSEVIRTVRLELVKMERDYAQMLERLGSEHPQLQALRTQVETMRTKIAMEAVSILQSVEMEYEQARREEELLRKRIKEQEADVFRFNDLAAQYNVLKQNKDSIETAYLTIARRIQEIDSSRIGAQGENIFVISRATPPTQHCWPSRGKNVLLALIVGLGAAVAVCFFLDYMDVTIQDDADVKHLLHTRVLSGIPGRNVAEGEAGVTDCIFSELPRSQTAEAFRSLRTSLSRTPTGEPLHAIVVSSTLPSEGKTFVAINLAIAQAAVNRRTILIDADMRKPRLHHVFPVTTTHGLADLLTGTAGASLDSAMQPTTIPNLWFMPCGILPAYPVEIIDSPQFTDLLLHLRRQFDAIIFDSPPGLSLIDSTVMAKQLDGMLLVIRSTITKKTPVQHFSQSLREARVHLLGVVLNNVDIPMHRYGYHYGYHYGRYQYGYSYGHRQAPPPSLRQRLAKSLRMFRQPRAPSDPPTSAA
jgi:succinoglycan biosynthesis transport protein ExoP